MRWDTKGWSGRQWGGRYVGCPEAPDGSELDGMASLCALQLLCFYMEGGGCWGWLGMAGGGAAIIKGS